MALEAAQFHGMFVQEQNGVIGLRDDQPTARRPGPHAGRSRGPSAETLTESVARSHLKIVRAPLDPYRSLYATLRGHYIPLPSSTYGIVCKRILMSPQSDQFATYR